MGTIFRLHSDPAFGRQPWNYGDEALNVSRAFMQMRVGLLPMLVSAGQRASNDGTPVVRRCDLEWPDLAKQGSDLSTQYLLGDDLLVAPVDPFKGKKAQGANGSYVGNFNRHTTVDFISHPVLPVCYAYLRIYIQHATQTCVVDLLSLLFFLCPGLGAAWAVGGCLEWRDVDRTEDG
jgi:hypothetical protein